MHMRNISTCELVKISYAQCRFFHKRNVKMPNLSRLLPNELQWLKFEAQLKFYSSILGVISQSFSWKLPMSYDMSHIFQKYACFCQVYNRNDRKQNNTFTNCGPQQKI